MTVTGFASPQRGWGQYRNAEIRSEHEKIVITRDDGMSLGSECQVQEHCIVGVATSRQANAASRLPDRLGVLHVVNNNVFTILRYQSKTGIREHAHQF